VSLDDPQGVFLQLLESDGHIIESMGMQCQGLNLTFHRGGAEAPKSAIYDEVSVHLQTQAPRSIEDQVKIVQYLDKELIPFDPARAIASGLTPEQATMQALHQSMLERLEQLNTKLAEATLSTHARLEERFAERVAESDRAFNERVALLDTEFSSKQENLDRKNAALDERAKSLDDRNNTHARREIRDRMLDDVKKRIGDFGVSKATERKRLPVFRAILALILAFSVLLGWTGWEIRNADAALTTKATSAASLQSLGRSNVPISPDEIDKLVRASAAPVDNTLLIWLWVRFGLLSAGLIATLIFYIRWRNAWADHHANSEFQLQQFYLDVNRANWVIESCLEWRKETNSIIPSTLVESVSRNLFASGDSNIDRVVHPADELASALLGTASRLKLRLGDHELEFDKPSRIRKSQAVAGPNP
jgi:hypothetical protein